jgi:hypothetical protein
MMRLDKEDLKYKKRGLEEFIPIYKAQARIEEKLKNKLPSLLKDLAKKHKLDSVILGIHNNSPKKFKKDTIGLIEFPTHWGSFYYIHDENIFLVYDSAHGKRDKSHFKNYMESYGGHVTQVGCGCVSKKPISIRATSIRPLKKVPRQPRAWNFSEPDDEPDNRKLTSYASQHQFCYMEALLFLEELLNERNVSKCKNAKESLITIKRYIMEKINVPEKFKYIWDPYNKKQVSIV